MLRDVSEGLHVLTVLMYFVGVDYCLPVVRAQNATSWLGYLEESTGRVLGPPPDVRGALSPASENENQRA